MQYTMYQRNTCVRGRKTGFGVVLETLKLKHQLSLKNLTTSSPKKGKEGFVKLVQQAVVSTAVFQCICKI